MFGGWQKENRRPGVKSDCAFGGLAADCLLLAVFQFPAVGEAGGFSDDERPEASRESDLQVFFIFLAVFQKFNPHVFSSESGYLSSDVRAAESGSDFLLLPNDIVDLVQKGHRSLRISPRRAVWDIVDQLNMFRIHKPDFASSQFVLESHRTPLSIII